MSFLVRSNHTTYLRDGGLGRCSPARELGPKWRVCFLPEGLCETECLATATKSERKREEDRVREKAKNGQANEQARTCRWKNWTRTIPGTGAEKGPRIKCPRAACTEKFSSFFPHLPLPRLPETGAQSIPSVCDGFHQGKLALDCSTGCPRAMLVLRSCAVPSGKRAQGISWSPVKRCSMFGIVPPEGPCTIVPW